MRRNKYLITVKSPQSAVLMDEEDNESFNSPNQALFSVLRPSKYPTKERIHYLWKRARVLLSAISRLIIVWKDIQKYGGKRNHFEQKIARRESSEVPDFDAGDSYLFFPNSLVIKCWTGVLLLLLIYTATVMPYNMSFIYTNDIEWVIIDSVIDCVFFLDILVTFNSAYYDEQMKLIQRRRTIAVNYLKFWFYLDLVSCLPVQVFEDNNHAFNKLIRISKVPRLIRIMRLFKLLKFVKVLGSIEIVRKIVEFINMSEGVVRLLKFFITVIMVVHINACIWHFIAITDDQNPDIWLLKPAMNGLSENEIYLASVYFVMQTIVTIGFGDIVPTTMAERIYTLFLLLIGVGFYSYIVGNLSNIVKALEIDTSRAKLMLAGLNEFAKVHKLPPRLKEKIQRYIEVSSETSSNVLDKNSLIKELPASLKNVVQIHIHKKIVERIFFFQDKSENFISRFVGKLKTLELNSTEVVFYKEDYAEEVYFISKGRVIIKGDYGVIVKNYMQGSYFGELEVLNNSFRKFTATVASATAILLIISKRDFLLILKEFPEIMQEVKATAKIREQKILDSACEILQSFLSNKCELNKAKTSHDHESKKTGQLNMSRQSWKHFVKNNLGIEEETDVKWTPSKSVWDDYQNYCNKEESTKKFVSRNSLTELFDRVKSVFTGSSYNIKPGLNKDNFAEPYLKIRTETKEKIIEKFEAGNHSPSNSINNSREHCPLLIGDILNDLCSYEQAAESKLFEISSALMDIHNQELAIKAKLGNFFVSNPKPKNY